MKTELSGIAKSILQVRAGVQMEASAKEAKEDISISFLDLMNQNSLRKETIGVETDAPELRTDMAKMANEAYDPYAAQPKDISVRESVTPEEMNAKAKEPVEEYEAGIRDLLKEELGVTDEEISAAMEKLGLAFLDLGSLQNLTALVQELTGEDAATLFLSDAFVNIAGQAAGLTQELCRELGMTQEELDAFCEAYKQMAKEPVPEVLAVESPEMPEETVPMQPQQAKQDNVTAQTAEKAVPAEAMQKEPDMLVQEQESEPEAENIRAAGQAGKEAESAPDQETGEQDGFGEKQQEQAWMGHTKSRKADLPQDGTIFAGHGHQAQIRTEEMILPREVQQPYAMQADAIDLIEQIAKNVRVTVSQTSSSMEMQLNPEHLGKIYLHISENEGTVRAQIAAQNQTVKEALEMHLADLRQSLGQQGVKVDAIEVTVGTHEFEQNLEENARQQEQMQQQRHNAQQRARRSINLNDLDGLTGLMSEEEQLAAQIMRDNGNQVDLTA